MFSLSSWNFNEERLIATLQGEHEGPPVRGVDFHPTAPLLVSGGDDYKIKVWDCQNTRCLHTFLGHLDYVRSVQFHPDEKLPWIMSSSNDQTVRLWDHNTRTCLRVLTGHNHYVTSASFHPIHNLIVSASLDRTIRVWDFTNLRLLQPGRRMGDFLGINDVVVKHVLKAHTEKINEAVFHPKLPLLASCGDDHQVKIWQCLSDETSAPVQLQSLRGHMHNVAICLFHPENSELLISASDDGSIGIWDTKKYVGIQTFTRQDTPFSALAAHPSHNLFAAGHEGGILVFGLEDFSYPPGTGASITSTTDTSDGEATLINLCHANFYGEEGFIEDPNSLVKGRMDERPLLPASRPAYLQMSLGFVAPILLGAVAGILCPFYVLYWAVKRPWFGHRNRHTDELDAIPLMSMLEEQGKEQPPSSGDIEAGSNIVQRKTRSAQ
jgi:hypothetical protein